MTVTDVFDEQKTMLYTGEMAMSSFQKCCHKHSSSGVLHGSVVKYLTHNPQLKFVIWERVNCLPNNKILASSKVKAFANGKFTDAMMMFSVFRRVESIVGKGENAGYQHFLLFPQCFQKSSWLCEKELTMSVSLI